MAAQAKIQQKFEHLETLRKQIADGQIRISATAVQGKNGSKSAKRVFVQSPSGGQISVQTPLVSCAFKLTEEDSAVNFHVKPYDNESEAECRYRELFLTTMKELEVYMVTHIAKNSKGILGKETTEEQIREDRWKAYLKKNGEYPETLKTRFSLQDDGQPSFEVYDHTHKKKESRCDVRNELFAQNEWRTAVIYCAGIWTHNSLIGATWRIRAIRTSSFKKQCPFNSDDDDGDIDYEAPDELIDINQPENPAEPVE